VDEAVKATNTESLTTSIVAVSVPSDPPLTSGSTRVNVVPVVYTQMYGEALKYTARASSLRNETPYTVAPGPESKLLAVYSVPVNSYTKRYGELPVPKAKYLPEGDRATPYIVPEGFALRLMEDQVVSQVLL